MRGLKGFRDFKGPSGLRTFRRCSSGSEILKLQLL